MKLPDLHGLLVAPRRRDRLADLLATHLRPGQTVADVGCGDGALAEALSERVKDLKVTGFETLPRPDTRAPVVRFNGRTIPVRDSSFDVVLLVDVLHHTMDPRGLLSEASRVTRDLILLKDHVVWGPFSRWTLRAMDWVGNAHHGVALPYNYLTAEEWRSAFKHAGLRPARIQSRLGLYPFPLSALFDRRLHLLACLEVAR